MLFNTIDFAIFLPIVFLFYWFATKRTVKFQNVLLLIASYFFYACWDWRFLFLLIFSTALDYYTGIKINEAENKNTKKIWLWISISINLGFLGFFKYYNFFIHSFSDAVSLFGLKINPWTLTVILPVGISFYTFHGLSYVIDIYNNRIKPERNYIDYAVFVSFFPLLVAGPIERATHLLPQIKQKRTFDYSKSVDGLRQILWGLFKKVVIADTCAEYANTIFGNFSQYTGPTLILGAVLFTFQIYCDFSGYSDIALGTARLFGIELLRNFAYPYFSRDIAEFWRRWHISLSSWFRDYLYIPLGGSKGGIRSKIRNTFIIFIVSGFWHGANWTFIAWGGVNALYFLPLLIFERNRDNIETVAAGRSLPNLKEVFNILTTFTLTVFAWIFFRSENLMNALSYIKRMILGLKDLAAYTDVISFINNVTGIAIFILIFFFIATEWLGRENKFAIEKLILAWKRPYRWVFYVMVILMISHYGGSEQEFIYFQF